MNGFRCTRFRLLGFFLLLIGKFTLRNRSSSLAAWSRVHTLLQQPLKNTAFVLILHILLVFSDQKDLESQTALLKTWQSRSHTAAEPREAVFSLEVEPLLPCPSCLGCRGWGRIWQPQNLISRSTWTSLLSWAMEGGEKCSERTAMGTPVHTCSWSEFNRVLGWSYGPAPVEILWLAFPRARKWIMQRGLCLSPWKGGKDICGSSCCLMLASGDQLPSLHCRGMPIFTWYSLFAIMQTVPMVRLLHVCSAHGSPWKDIQGERNSLEPIKKMMAPCNWKSFQLEQLKGTVVSWCCSCANACVCL